MRFLQRRFILFAASIVFGLIYASLREYPFAWDVAVCASFTTLVFGNAIRRRGFGLFAGDDSRPLAEILLIHFVCLAALIVLIRMGSYITPVLPDWLGQPIGADRYGPGPSAFKLLQTAGLFLLSWVELLVMTTETTPAEKAARNRARHSGGGMWSDRDLDRMSALRLRR